VRNSRRRSGPSLPRFRIAISWGVRSRPVYDKRVSRPLSCKHALRTPCRQTGEHNAGNPAVAKSRHFGESTTFRPCVTWIVSWDCVYQPQPGLCGAVQAALRRVAPEGKHSSWWRPGKKLGSIQAPVFVAMSQCRQNRSLRVHAPSRTQEMGSALRECTWLSRCSCARSLILRY
jgi:hypothetical protein